MKSYKADCKNCGGRIEWLQGLGWIHTDTSKCKKPVPDRKTIK